ncbi:MAG: MotA/TolQ/ExbB proton channel family protein [Pseudobdellovibrionaceae bacterium]|nr:MotA/TolQ/ExbB proton channel family protein [Bdellovibrionales bacterium]USN47787.1 MAG: MotA/TolQ/ExbB proton channel family protein [Pseudobdellovibrionaceae bacterium]
MLQDLAEKFQAGGPFMWPILLCSGLGLAIMIERWLVLRAATNVSKEELLDRLNSYILKGDLVKAVRTVSKTSTPLTNIVHSGLVTVANGGTSEDVQTSMDAVALREIPRLEKRIGLLATLSNIATLLGLLGTVTGLIGAFAAVAKVAADKKAEMLSSAIAEAMNTTAFGLIVAIPLLAAFGYLNSKSQEVTDDIHETSVSTLNFIMVHKDKFKSS